jgi:hypothetical protein
LERWSYRLLDGPGFAVLCSIRWVTAVAATAFFAAGAWTFAAFACLAVVVTSALTRARLVYGLDGADQLQAVLWIGLLVFTFDPYGVLGLAGVTFIGCQFVVAYMTSGIAKAVSREWLSGRAIPGVVTTESYGSRITSRSFRGIRGRLAGYGVIMLEAIGPMAALTIPVLIGPFVVASVSFHLVIAGTMRLNNFVWAFVGALGPFAFLVRFIHQMPI